MSQTINNPVDSFADFCLFLVQNKKQIFLKNINNIQYISHNPKEFHRLRHSYKRKGDKMDNKTISRVSFYYSIPSKILEFLLIK